MDKADKDLEDRVKRIIDKIGNISNRSDITAMKTVMQLDILQLVRETKAEVRHWKEEHDGAFKQVLVTEEQLEKAQTRCAQLCKALERAKLLFDTHARLSETIESVAKHFQGAADLCEKALKADTQPTVLHE